MFSSQVAQLAQIRVQHATIMDRIAEVRAFLKDFRDSGGNRIQQTMFVDSQQYSIQDVMTFGDQSIRAFKAIKFLKGTPLVTGAWNTIVQGSAALENVSGEFSTQIRAILAPGHPEVTIGSGSRIFVKETGSPFADMTDMSNRFVNAADQLLNGIAMLAGIGAASLSVGNAPDDDLVRDDAKASAEALSEIENAKRQALEMVASLAAASKGLDELNQRFEGELSAAAKASEEELGRLKASLSTISESATNAAADATVALSKREELDRLNAQAQDAFRDIGNFQTNLAATEKRLSEAHATAQAAADEFASQKSTVDELIAAANTMVSGATVAGLASAFAEERKGLEKSMAWAMFSFFIGIAFLGLASLILAAYVLNIPLPGLAWLTMHGNSKADAEISLSGVISRAVIIIAPFWMTLFSARRYRSLFDLRQQYSHKYNMAFSMNGFKNQAPTFGEGIAAWVFSIVAANPTLQPSGKSMDAPPPTSVEAIVTGVKAQLDKLLKPAE